MIGVVDERVAPALEFVSSGSDFLSGEPTTSLVAESPAFTVHQVRWQVLDGLSGEGLYVNPIREEGAALTTPPPAIVLLPDAGETPEDLLGIGNRLPPEQQMGLRFAEAGFRLIIPATIQREIYLGFSHNSGYD